MSELQNNTGTRMQDSIYHITLISLANYTLSHDFAITVKRNVFMDVNALFVYLIYLLIIVLNAWLYYIIFQYDK